MNAALLYGYFYIYTVLLNQSASISGSGSGLFSLLCGSVGPAGSGFLERQL